MEKIAFSLLLFVLAIPMAKAQFITLPQASKKASVSEEIGLTTVSIDYHRPRVNGREGQVWGQLIPYGTPWRAGANDNTVISFEHDVKINGKDLKAGAYGFHIIPNETGDWTLIFSHTTTAWGSFAYKQEEDALRVNAKPSECDMTEWLKFEITSTDNNAATVNLKWEKMQVGFDIEVDLHEITLASIRNELGHLHGFTWQGWNQAAQYCLNNDVNLEEGLQWVEMSISGSPFFSEANFNNLQTKGQILAKLGKEEESAKVMEQVVAKANMGQLHFYARSLIQQGKNKEAMKMFKLNRERNPEDNFTTFVGLARGHMALGNNKEAVMYFRKAAPNAPQGQQQIYENLAKKLEEKS